MSSRSKRRSRWIKRFRQILLNYLLNCLRSFLNLVDFLSSHIPPLQSCHHKRVLSGRRSRNDPPPWTVTISVIHSLFLTLPVSGSSDAYPRCYKVEKGSTLDVESEMNQNRDFYRIQDVRPPFTYAALIRQVSQIIIIISVFLADKKQIISGHQRVPRKAVDPQRNIQLVPS